MLHRWGSATFSHLLGLFQSEHAKAAGITMALGHTLLKELQPEDPFWADIVFSFKRLSSRELSMIAPPEVVDGYTYNTIICEGRCV